MTDLTIDLATNTASCHGKQWPVTPKVAKFLDVVVKARPQPAKDDVLFSTLWASPIRASSRRHSNLAVYAHHANAMLAPIGMRVYRVRNVGYRLINIHGVA